MPDRFHFLVLLAILFACVRVEARPIVWVAPALTRVARDDAPRETREIILWAGRGEYESYQVIVHGPAEGLEGGTISVSGLVGPVGRSISGGNIQLYRERYVHIGRGSPDRGGSNRPLGPGWYPDALIPIGTADGDSHELSADKNKSIQPLKPFRVAEGKNLPFWVDISVPRDAEAGEYQGI